MTKLNSTGTSQVKAIEQVHDYWNPRRFNIRHSTKPFEARKNFVESRIFQFPDFKYWHRRKVLEIGCAPGTDTIKFACQGAQVRSVDLTESSRDPVRSPVVIRQPLIAKAN
jgi:2-polyprenyl-3-methyl-5-hydroxy-6-metoxy-1,4-benzoquinol methylase